MIEPNTTIIIVNWQLKERTIECLRSLRLLNAPHNVIVVDNGSCDDSVATIDRNFPEVNLISLPSNVGFGAACNGAIRVALESPGCRFILLLNNDTVVHPNALAEMIKEAKAHPHAGVLGPKIYYLHAEKETFWYAGARCRPRVLAAVDTGRGQIDRGQFDSRHEVDFVFGAAMLVRREVFAHIGLFDPMYFLYLEDMDFCLRARQAGFTIRFVPPARVWHYGSASTENNSAFRRYHYARSTVLFLKKHTSLLQILPVLSFWLLVFVRAVALDVWQGNISEIQSYLAGLLHGLAKRVPS